MLRINSDFRSNRINTLEQTKKSPSFKAAENPIANHGQIPAVTPDFAVKTPMAYQKISDIELPFENKASLYKLVNGQRVVIVPKEGKTVIKTYVNTGSMNEPDKLRGISHYIEHNLFNGSEGLEAGDFFKKVDDMGASTNASTGFSETNYFISSNLLNKNDLEEKVKLHASMLETPRFATEMLEKEKGIVNSEINMITGNPLNVGINKTLKNLYQINTNSVDMIGGTTSNITNLSREDVVKYFDENYYPANMVTVVTGEVQPDEVMKLISKHFTSNKKPPSNRYYEDLKPIQNPVREDIISDKATATSVILAFDGPKNGDTKDRILAQAMAEMLTMSKTSRIDKKLKDLNSSAFTEIERISTRPNDGRAIMMIAEGTEENSEKIIKTIYTEISKLASNPPSEDELNVVKKRMMKQFSNLFEQSAYVNALLGGAFQDNDVNILTQYEKTVSEMTPQDISDVAKRYLNLNKASLTVVHPATATEESIRANHNKAAISFTGSAKPKQAINMDSVKEYKLPNNFSVVLHDTNNDNAVFDILYSANKYPENIKPATTALLFKLLNSGTFDKTEQEFQGELDKLAVDMVFASGATDLKVKSNYFSSDDMQEVLKQAKAVLGAPRFREQALDKVKSELRDEIGTSEKSAADKLLPEIYKGIPSGYSKEDVLKSIDDVTMDDVKNLYDFIIKNGQANIVVSAPFSRKPELKQTVFTEIAMLEKVAPKNSDIKNSYEDIAETKVLTDVHAKPQAQIIQAYKFKVNNNMKDEITLNLLDTILGGSPSSRLFKDLRETQHLAYSVRSNMSVIDDIGSIALQIGTTTENLDTNEVSYDNVQKSINGFNKHIERIKTEKVTDEELRNAKLSLKNAILNVNETNRGKNKSLEYGLISPYGIQQENLILETIDSITADDIYNAANYVFKGKPIYSILATENTLAQNKDFLNSLIEKK